MDKKGVRIISLEAREIVKQIQNNGEDAGYILPEKKSSAYFYLFRNILDYSLDAIELEKSYLDICRKKFSFQDKKQNEHTLAVINVTFKYTLKDDDGVVLKDLKQLRAYLYQNGFNLGGVHYVRYKRSSGSSRQGKCLFIDERMYKHMAKWGECGLKPTADLASWEAYKALSLSDILGIVKIPLEGILYVEDYKSAFEEEVISVEESNGRLVSEKKSITITNDIWDGESLLDESIFQEDYADKHMLLLRNKFFKSCAFKTKLQKWFQDKNITLEDLKARGFITLATDISQIVMVTTPNSMKYLKFMKGGLTETNVRRWSEEVDEGFGVVKYDKPTKFLGGTMVQTSYQFINTLPMSEAQAAALLQPSEDYIKLIRKDYDFMSYHFSDVYNRKSDNDKEELADGLAERGDVIFRLMHTTTDFKDTQLYINFRNEVVETLKKRLMEGHILLSGTNATLFGNGSELLLALSGEFNINEQYTASQVLGKKEVACAKFTQGARLVCARSPHITMGNLYCVTNNSQHDIWQYFDLGENIVCVNAIGENIQQRLNGCDYDSDAMLVTDDKQIVEIANEREGEFLVPVCNIRSVVKENQTLEELDFATSENIIGEIVNLSQKLNSILWDSLNGGEFSQENRETLYRNICILAVLSGIEIDKAKRAYQSVDVGAEVDALSKDYEAYKPQFFEIFENAEIERRVRYVYAKGIEDKEERKKATKKLREEKRKGLKEKKHYSFYHTAMQYVYQLAGKIDGRTGKPKKVDHVKIIDIIREPAEKDNSTAYSKRDAIIRISDEYYKQLNVLYKELNMAEDDEKELIYACIQETKKERNEKVCSLLTSEKVLYLVLKHYDKGGMHDWQRYAPILDNPLFVSMLKKSKTKLCEIVEDEDGEYSIYGKKYKKVED